MIRQQTLKAIRKRIRQTGGERFMFMLIKETLRVLDEFPDIRIRYAVGKVRRELPHLFSPTKYHMNEKQRLEQIRLAALQQNVMSKQQATKPQTQPTKENNAHSSK